ncbi:MAG TPA: hypothetical protein VF447_11360 [Terriglobales bacterium]
MKPDISLATKTGHFNLLPTGYFWGSVDRKECQNTLTAEDAENSRRERRENVKAFDRKERKERKGTEKDEPQVSAEDDFYAEKFELALQSLRILGELCGKNFYGRTTEELRAQNQRL